MNFKTGFGYYKKNGLVVMKFVLPIGEHPVLEGYEVVEVADEKTLAAVEIYKAPVVETEDQKINTIISEKVRTMAIEELKKEGILTVDGKLKKEASHESSS